MSRSNDIAGLTTSILDGVTKTEVGLGNVDNTSDANKPVSTAQQSAIDLKANIASPTFTGTTNVSSGVTFPTNPTITLGSNATFPADHIIQVKHKNYTTINGYNSISTSRVVISDFYQDITPKFSDSLILAQAHISVGFDGTPEWSWFIDAEISSSSSSWVSTGTRTILGAAAQVGNRMQGYHGGPRDNGAANFTDEVEGYSNTVSHTPSSTNPIRYQVCFMNRWSNSYYYYINRSHLDGNSGYTTRGTSTLTLYEVKQ